MRALLVLIVAVSPVVGAASPAPPAPKYGPAEAPRAVPLSRDHAYLQDPAHPAPDYWALAPYYAPQFNDMSCSAAAVTAVVNGALRAGRLLGNEERNVTQQALLDKVRTHRWKERVNKGGWHGAYGLTLEQLRDVTRDALVAYGAASVEVQSVDASATNAEGEAGLAAFRRVLEGNERSASDFVLVHFVQDGLTGAPGGPYAHISPVGAYDAERRRVLVMDVDREWYEPYWVADDVLWRAMSVRTKAFGSGGWVRVSIR